MTREIRQDGRSHLTGERDASRTVTTREPKPSDYLEDVAVLGHSEEDAFELLKIIFSIMESFARMGFKADVCAYLFHDFAKASRGESKFGYASSGSNEEEAGKE